MVRKGKRSEAQKQRWRRGKETGCEAAGQPTFTQSVVSTAQASAVHTRCDITSVLASHSQADVRYRESSRNRQCTCNSLMFLAMLHERRQLQSTDLDLVLESGDLLYSSVRNKLMYEGRFVHDFLAFDELPNEVAVHEHTYSVTKHLSRYGYLRRQGPDSAEDFLTLSVRLQCLVSEVKYALLTLSNLTIALFRDQSGRYGFFDPHPRTPDGLPCMAGNGTAVMITFVNLSDLTERLLLFHEVLQSPHDYIYEFMPVWITSLGSCSTEHQPAHSEETISAPGCSIFNLEPTMIEEPSASLKTLTNLKQSKDRRRRKVISKEQQPHVSRKEMNRLRQHNYYERKKTEKLKYASRKYANTAQHKKACLKERYFQDANYRQEKISYAKLHYSQDATYQLRKKSSIKDRYSQDASYRLRKKSSIKERYSQDASYRLRKKSSIKDRYSQDASYRLRKKSSIKDRYSQDASYRLRKKSSIKDRYSQDASYRLRKKSSIKDRYSQDASYRLRKKSSIKERYSQDADYRLRKKSSIKDRYSQDADYRLRKKSSIKDRYSQDADYRFRQKSYMQTYYACDSAYKRSKRQNFTERYQHDPDFRRHRILNNSLKASEDHLRILHKLRCSLHIQRKYRQFSLSRQLQGQQNKNKQHPAEIVSHAIQQAISSFRMETQVGPTYICTVCHRALFPNQVKVCKRENYKRNLDVVLHCLTGKYVHMCSHECSNLQQCSLPERRSEWVCYSCHENLMIGNIPSIAAMNKMELSPIPPELCDLNVLERHIIAKYIPFAKIISLPKGQQRAIVGSLVCVCSEVESTVNVLPRPSSQSQLLKVKLKRKMAYKGHYQFQTLDMHKVLHALSKLKEIHPEYKDILIRDDPAAFEFTDLTDEENVMDAGDIAADIAEATALMENDRWDDDAELETMEQHSEKKKSSGPSEERSDDENADEEDVTKQNATCQLDTCLQPADIAQELLTFGDGIFCIAPAEGNRPVGFFKVPKIEAMAFPVQFPTGENTLDEMSRIRKVTPSRYFNARLFSVDNRFALDANYIFFAQCVTELHLATSSMTIQLRKGKPLTRDGRKITARMLQDKQEVERLVHNKDATRFMQPLRGTPAYWEKTLRDLFAMLRQLGTPTFFCTFSAAEMRWPEFIEVIKAQQGEEVDFAELDWATKCEILRSNAVTTMRMFEKRVDALMKYLLLSPAKPIGEVIDYFYRVEYQARGSPHIHLLAWCQNAPVFEEDPDEKICEFVDSYITCQLPEPETDPELFKIVKEVQMHSRSHSKSCKKGNKHCRFGFPKPPTEKTFITRPDRARRSESDSDHPVITPAEAKRKLKPLWALLNDPKTSFESTAQLLAQCKMSYEEYLKNIHSLTSSSVIMMKRQPKDSWVNAYNKHLLRAWNANMDIQFILNPYSCIMYILSYISKAEHEMSDFLKKVSTDIRQGSTSDREEMKQIMQAYSKLREVSIQEAVARVCSLKLKSCSRSVIFVPTDDNALKMSLPLRCLNDKVPESENIWMSGLPEKYKNRPGTPEFGAMCMADFASTYRVVYGRQKSSGKALALQNNMGFIQRRTHGKPAVIRYARFSEKKSPEKFYGTLLKLYLPHRSDAQLKPKGFTSYQHFYSCGSVQLPGQDHLQAVFAIVHENRSKYEKNNVAIDKAIEELEKNGPMEDAWTTLAPETELVRLECISERGERNPEEIGELDEVPEYCRSPTKRSSNALTFEPSLIDPNVVRSMYRNLNLTQASIFYTIRSWCRRCVYRENPGQFFYFVTGGAGTGKSHLIKCIYTEATKILQKLPSISEESDIYMPTVLLTAFTGTAAFNISGKTLHSILKLPRRLTPPYQGLGNGLDELRAQLCKAEIIIIDEISMVSKSLFAYVNWRLQEIKGSKKPFGGMSVLAVGDFYQLPPPGKAKPLCVFEEHVVDFWQDLFHMIELTEIMRQKEDVAFAELLNRIRVKRKGEALSEEDRAFLTQAVAKAENCPKDVLHVFATNKGVDQHNAKTISALHEELVNVDAYDYKKDLQTGRMERQSAPFQGRKGDLPDTLQVAKGARIMLIRNIDVEDGLVNGSFGKIGRIVHEDQHGKAAVKLLGVELDNSHAGKKHQHRISGGQDNLVYIERIEEPLSKKGVIRHQFPLKLAFACTAHKVQGMTTASAVVSLRRVFEPGMAYVALSRTTSFRGLRIIDFNEDKIYSDVEITSSLENMQKAACGHATMLLSSLPDVSAPCLTVVHHNTEGLSAHIDDVKRHHEMLLGDILCFTETHLSGHIAPDDVHLEGYQLYKRNRHVSYLTHSHLSNQKGGGVAMYVKTHIQAAHIQYVQNVTDLEFLVIKVEAPLPATIAVIYRPPNYSTAQFLPNLCSLLDALDIISHHPIIVCGDFNEDLLADQKKPILDCFQCRGYTQLIKAATTERNTLLDHIYISSPEHCAQSGVMQTYYSYHEPVFCIAV